MTRLSTPRKSLPKRSQKGFSLLEVLLAVTIAIGLGSMQLGQLKRETETKQAQIVGQQIRMVGNALNAYMAQHYGSIVAMGSYPAPGDAEHPGPVVCNPGTGICTITSDTLRRAGLLPASFSGRNSYGSTYNYYIRVTGPTDYWRVDGVVVTNDPYTVGGAVRHDMIGAAMLEAGADSGSTRTVANQINGYNGTWLETSFPQVNQIGLLAYRAGYGSSNNSAYLRVDGSLPMSNNLKMTAENVTDPNLMNSIVQVKDIEGYGTSRFAKFFTRQSASDAIVLGSNNMATASQIGNSASSPDRLKVTNEGGLELVSSAGNYTDLYTRNITGTGNLNVSGTGYFGGSIESDSLTTRNAILARGGLTSLGSIESTNGYSTATGSYVTTNGDITALNGTISSRDLIVTRNANITGNVLIGSNLDVQGELRIGGSGWRYDTASNTLLTTTNANFTANNITANGYMNLGTARGTSGSACSLPNGTIGLDNTSGQVIACSGGVWRGSALTNTYSITGAAGRTSTAVCAANERVTGCTANYISRVDADTIVNAFTVRVNNSTECIVTGAPGVTLEAVAVCAR